MFDFIFDEKGAKMTIKQIINYCFDQRVLSIIAIILALLTLIYTKTIGDKTNYISEIMAPCVYSIECKDKITNDIKEFDENFFICEDDTIVDVGVEKGSIYDIGNILIRNKGKGKQLYKINSFVSSLEHQNKDTTRSTYFSSGLSLKYTPSVWNWVENTNYVYSIIYVKPSFGDTDVWLLLKEINSKSYSVYGSNCLGEEFKQKKFYDAIKSYRYAREFIIKQKI